MPYAFENPKHRQRMPRQYDRRIKLSDDERRAIKELQRHGVAIREIARRYPHVSRRLIQFVIWPERLAANRRLRDWSKWYRKEKHRAYMKNHRRYKQTILKTH